MSDLLRMIRTVEVFGICRAFSPHMRLRLPLLWVKNGIIS